MAEERDEQQLEDSVEEEAPSPLARARSSRGRRRRRKRRPRSGDLFLVTIVLLIALVLIAFGPERVFYTLYNKTAGLILIVMVIEYLVLKSMDRTRVYELENARLRERMRQDRALLKTAAGHLADYDAEPQEDETPEESRARWQARADVLAQEIRERL